MYSSTCFGRPHAYHQEFNKCSSSLWFYRWSVVIAVLLVVASSWLIYLNYETEFYVFLQMVLHISFLSHLTLDIKGLTSEVTKNANTNTNIIEREKESSDVLANYCVRSKLMYNVCYLKYS
jgi:hypothetical protein